MLTRWIARLIGYDYVAQEMRVFSAWNQGYHYGRKVERESFNASSNTKPARE